MKVTNSPLLPQTIKSFRFDDENEYARFLKKKKKTRRKASFYFFLPKKLVRLFMLKEVKASPDSKMIKHLITYSRYYDILAKNCRRLTTATPFSRQNDARSRVSNTKY